MFFWIFYSVILSFKRFKLNIVIDFILNDGRTLSVITYSIYLCLVFKMTATVKRQKKLYLLFIRIMKCT